MNLANLIENIQKQPREVGGFFEMNSKGKFTFFKTAAPKINTSVRREYVDLPTGSHPLIWHYHPMKVGIWPSFEDLQLGYPTKNKPFPCYVNLILTIYGTWVFDGLCKHNKKQSLYDVENNMYEAWKKFNDFMMIETQKKGWDLMSIKNAIEQFRYELFIHFGYRITFIDNGMFRPEMKNKRKYTKDIKDYILYLIKDTN